MVLDKDNCIARDHDDRVWPAYEERWSSLKKEYPGRLLIVSNSAGTNDDLDGQAQRLEKNTGVPVLRHSTKKPGCWPEIVAWFEQRGVAPHEIAVVGDRLFTDILMANMMGSYGTRHLQRVAAVQHLRVVLLPDPHSQHHGGEPREPVREPAQGGARVPGVCGVRVHPGGGAGAVGVVHGADLPDRAGAAGRLRLRLAAHQENRRHQHDQGVPGGESESDGVWVHDEPREFRHHEKQTYPVPAPHRARERARMGQGQSAGRLLRALHQDAPRHG
ncbi:hypothetical protein KL919_000292 [Ogataea angusta]|nr:hypothetical protein KL919_000292 [Ogataea angusta]